MMFRLLDAGQYRERTSLCLDTSVSITNKKRSNLNVCLQEDMDFIN